MNLPDSHERGAEETARFLAATLPKPPCAVLEVGCGTGAVASRLMASGYTLTGLDVVPEAIATCRQRGVDAAEGDFLTWRDRNGPYDAVIFTRSLHHADSIQAAIERAFAMLKPKGFLIAEEFAVEKMDLDTARWFYELLSLLEAAGLLRPDPEHEAAASNQLDRWFEEHEENGGRPIHTGEDMMVAVGARFEIQRTESAPYLYRYVGERLTPTPHSARVANWVFEVESMRIAQMTLKPVGLRVCGRRAA